MNTKKTQVFENGENIVNSVEVLTARRIDEKSNQKQTESVTVDYGLPGTCKRPHRDGWPLEFLRMLCTDLLFGDFRTRVTIFSCKNHNKKRTAITIRTLTTKPEIRNWKIIKHTRYKRSSSFIVLLLLLLLHCFIVRTRWSAFFIVYIFLCI